MVALCLAGRLGLFFFFCSGTGAKKDPQNQKIARTAPKNFLNNSRGLPVSTQENKGFEAESSPESSPESSAKSLSRSFFDPLFDPKLPRKSLCGSLFCVLSQEMRHIIFFSLAFFGWGGKFMFKKLMCFFSSLLQDVSDCVDHLQNGKPVRRKIQGKWERKWKMAPRPEMAEKWPPKWEK